MKEEVLKKNHIGKNMINDILMSSCVYIRKLEKLLTACIVFLTLSINAYAIQGDSFAHDPSSIVKDGNTYWIFYTADGIGSKYSTDLIKWTGGPTPYTKTVWPSWITTYAKAFSGSFWAPECIYMNGLYHLYYAAAGSGECCIGLITSPSLNNPVWTDQGVVVSSVAANDNSSAIDPDVFFDATGRLWITYGSWLGGIKMVELNAATGKPLNATIFSPCTLYDAENSQVVHNGSYYYMFVNRGLCCKDANSTYYIQVGRSTSVTGPYSEWQTVLSTSGSYIGPGGIGYYQEAGVEWASFHYYDGDNPFWKGAPTLAIGRYSWSNGWPTISLDPVKNGTYKITNVNSGLVWTNYGCEGVSLDPVVQQSWDNLMCQKWDFTHLGNGYYKITCAKGGLSTDVSGCSAENSASLDLYQYWGGNCQIWHIERTNKGDYVMSSKNGNRVLEVPNASLFEGRRLSLFDYSGNAGQKWAIDSVSKSLPPVVILANDNAIKHEDTQVFPNPVVTSKQSTITINLGRFANAKNVTANIFDMYGKLIFEQAFNANNGNQVEIDSNLKPGTYILTINNSNEIITKKLVVQ